MKIRVFLWLMGAFSHLISQVQYVDVDVDADADTKHRQERKKCTDNKAYNTNVRTHSLTRQRREFFSNHAWISVSLRPHAPLFSFSLL